ncbi:MAG TPA: glycosyltransferase family 2 protein [Phycisphaerae bacterium]|nr:glycosyltransferase family 2 protein [Phycisphaerae bacterium]
MDSLSDEGSTDAPPLGVFSPASAGRRSAQATPRYSIVVPFYNEAEIVEKLYGRIARVMKHVGRTFEMIFVNDGSRDGTGEILARIAAADERVVFVDLRRNFGQTTALQAGFDYAAGQVIIAMDGDLQHDPYEIPLFVRKIDEGWDVASGWRVRRGDNFLLRRLPSRVANWLLAKVSGVRLHDFGTTFKAYRREVLEGVRLYGDMHRYVPAIIAQYGARICEVPIKNVRRPAGKSNYGIGRTLRVALDLITVRFVTGYMTRPLHFFGKWGLGALAVGGGILAYGLIRKLIQRDRFHVFQEHGPLMAMGCMLVITAMLLICTGLIGEMLVRVYFEARGGKTYAIRRVIRGGKTEG